MRNTSHDVLPYIPEFYAGQSILITGPTGFLGKVLIEKILRSCPDVREIFLLMRPRKGVAIDERLKKMISLPLFEKLHATNPKVFEKLIPVEGNVSVEGLGLSSVERQFLIDRVSMIFHVAASVRFDDNMQDAIFTNTRSTRDICILAENMKNLKVLVHVSSTYAHADKPVVEEVTYPFEVDWKNTIKIAETVDKDVLQIFTAKFLGTMPNTYTFTKRLAEQVILDYSKVLPCVIFRPSIVISMVEEPLPGWIDNLNGPVSLMIVGGKGILRVTYCDPNTVCDYMPVDVAIKGMLTVAMIRGLKTITEDSSLPVYNCSAWNTRCLCMREVIAMAFWARDKIPLDPVWAADTLITKSWTLFYVMTLLCHLLPAILVDTALKLSGRRPILVKVQQKIYTSTYALCHFATNEWVFKNDKLLDLQNRLSPADQETFGYDYRTLNLDEYFVNCLIGAKKYLLKEDMSKLEQTRLRHKRLCWIDRIVKVTFFSVCVWVAYTSDVMSSMLGYLYPTDEFWTV